MSKPEAGQLTTDDLIAIGKAASFLRFEATYKTHATDEARKEWREVADALTDIECRNHPATPISPEAILGDPVCGVTMQKAEDPDEWVVQDRVPVRNCDQWCWKEHGTPEEWEWENGCIGYFMHGQRGYNAILHVRCRRRDLPKVEQPEQWPKYYMAGDRSNSIAFIRRDSERHYTPVMHDGTELRQQPWFGSDNHRLELTEAEAMALLKKPEPRNRDEALAMLVDEGQKLGMYGTPQTAKTRVRLWISAVDGSVYFGESARLRTDCEIHHDAEGFYVEETK